MHILPIMRCNRDLDFRPRSISSSVMPAFCWRTQLLTGFDRTDGEAVELANLAIDDDDSPRQLVDALKACYPHLGLGELARLDAALKLVWPEIYSTVREAFFRSYDLRVSERLDQTLFRIRNSPPEFQHWTDEKQLSTRDLAPLLSLEFTDSSDFLSALANSDLTRTEGVRALELGAELLLLGNSLADLYHPSTGAADFLKRLESRRQPEVTSRDEKWSQRVRQWPWPKQVRGEWQRFGDESGLKIEIRATSPDDLSRKLERLVTIKDTWSCKS